MENHALATRFEAQRQYRLRMVDSERADTPATPQADPWAARKQSVRQRLLDRAPTLWRDPNRAPDQVRRALRTAIAEEEHLAAADQDTLFQIMEAEILGFGLVDVLMHDSTVTEIIIDNPNSVGYIRNGEWAWLTTDFPNTAGERVGFGSAEALQHWFEQITRHSERSLTYESPLLDDDLDNGERLNATGPPVSEFLTVNIRKSVAQTHRYSPEEYSAQNVWSPEMAAFLFAAVAGYANVIVAGPTNSGKTTLIRILLENGVSPQDRIISIEDIRETNAQHPRFLSLATVNRKNNPIGFQDLFATSMRKTPTRVMVSELRGPAETVAYFQTIASGHPGAITSQHGDDPLDIVDWLVARAIQGGLASIPDLVQRMVYRTLHLIVFIRPIGGGRRRVTGVYELVPVELQGSGQPPVRALFEWDRHTDTHQWLADPLDVHRDRWEFHEGVVIPRRPTGTEASP